MNTIKSEFEMIAPERMQILRKINKMIRIGSIKEFSIDEQIEMSGVMAEAAAAFYFSDTVKKEMESVRLDLYEAAMLVAGDMIKNLSGRNLRMRISSIMSENTGVQMDLMMLMSSASIRSLLMKMEMKKNEIKNSNTCSCFTAIFGISYSCRMWKRSVG